MSSDSEQATISSETPNNASDTLEERTPDGNQRDRRNNANNARRQQFNNSRRTEGARFKGKIDEIESLTTKDESKNNNFTKFKADILQYVLKNFSNSTDIVPALKADKDPIDSFNQKAPLRSDIRKRLGLTIIDPPTSTESATAKELRETTNKEVEDTVQAIWQGEIKMFVQRNNELKTNMAKLWSIIKDQCSYSLREELRAETDYLTKESSYDVIWLLNALQRLTSGITDTNNRYYSIYHATKDFYKIRQGRNESLAEYYERFETAANLVTMSGGAITNSDLLLGEELKTNAAATEADVMQRFLAIAFVECADSFRYVKLRRWSWWPWWQKPWKWWCYQ